MREHELEPRPGPVLAGCLPGGRRPRFRLTLDRIELAAGRDDLLRGGPEPALLQPRQMRTRHPELYAVLAEYYGVEGP